MGGNGELVDDTDIPQKVYYLYELISKVDNRQVYVGMTSDPSRRLKYHLRYSDLLYKNKPYRMKILETFFSAESARNAEKDMHANGANGRCRWYHEFDGRLP